MKTIGIIGAGQMGNGIAHVCALSGYDVRLLDVNPEALPKALNTISGNLDRQVARGKIKAEDKEKALKRITTGTDYEMFRDCDLVIEAATENEAIKRDVFKSLKATTLELFLKEVHDSLIQDGKSLCVIS